MQPVNTDIKDAIVSIIKNEMEKYSPNQSKWLSLKEAAKYAGVSNNKFVHFRLMGLKVCEIDGIKRVSKNEIDRFLEEHSF